MRTQVAPLAAATVWLVMGGEPAMAQAVAIGESCIASYSAEELPASFSFNDKPNLAPTDAEEIVIDILHSVGMARRITAHPSSELRTACAATVRADSRRVIYYGPEWLHEYAKGDYWIMVGILAHEIGHHVNAHGPTDGLNPWQREIEADEFLGNVVRLLGGTVDDAVRVVAFEPVEGSKTHPNRPVRIAMVKEGFGPAAAATTPSVDVKSIVGTDAAKALTTQAASAASLADLSLWQAEAKAAYASAAQLVSTGDLTTTYDVILQIGHYPEPSRGTVGVYTTEQELSALLATMVADRLQAAGVKTLVIGAKGYAQPLKTKIFLALHLDGGVRPCTVGPSVGYGKDSDKEGMLSMAMAIAVAMNYDVRDFLQSNYHKGLEAYYAYRHVEASLFEGVLNFGEMTCPANEERILARKDVLADNLATALRFAISE